MDRETLIRRFRHIISLASLAYAFTILHTIQYSMRDHDNLDHDNLNDDGDTTTAQTSGDHDATNFSASSTHNTVNTPTASTRASENLEKTSKWSEAEVELLLNYVEANCILTTARGLNLKKSEFNRASAVVRTKDSSQCHYKWGNVGIFFYQLEVSSSLIQIYRSSMTIDLCYIQGNFTVG
jgi:hypothetical protein